MFLLCYSSIISRRQGDLLAPVLSNILSSVLTGASRRQGDLLAPVLSNTSRRQGDLVAPVLSTVLSDLLAPVLSLLLYLADKAIC